MAVVLAFCCAKAFSGERPARTPGAVPSPYVGATIVSPEDDAAVRSNAGNLRVLARVDPTLQEEHRLQLTLDGVPEGTVGRETTFELANIDRGTHRLQLLIVDDAGEIVFTGRASTFHLLRHSRLHP